MPRVLRSLTRRSSDISSLMGRSIGRCFWYAVSYDFSSSRSSCYSAVGAAYLERASSHPRCHHRARASSGLSNPDSNVELSRSEGTTPIRSAQEFVGLAHNCPGSPFFRWRAIDGPASTESAIPGLASFMTAIGADRHPWLRQTERRRRRAHCRFLSAEVIVSQVHAFAAVILVQRPRFCWEEQADRVGKRNMELLSFSKYLFVERNIRIWNVSSRSLLINRWFFTLILNFLHIWAYFAFSNSSLYRNKRTLKGSKSIL